jgi:flagellar hook assembly protein FlgD
MGFTGTPNATPAHTALRLAFPNPFDRSTTVVFALAQTGPASVRVFDVAGRNVRTLVSGVQPAGERVLAWDGRDDQGGRLGAGVYMLRLEAGGHSETRSVRLVR